MPPSERRTAETGVRSPVDQIQPVGELIMRSNSGNDQGRNNMRDPTMRERTEQRKKRSDRSHASHARAPADHRGGRKD